MSSMTEEPTVQNLVSDDPQPPFSQSVRVTAGQESLRPPKAVLLPEIARLSLEGHPSKAIARELGVPRRTVDHWLRQQRQQWAESAADNAAELFAVAMARLESVYREAVEAWRRSLADKQVTVVRLGSNDAAKPNGTLRKTTQSGQAAFLGKAIHAAGEIAKFNAKHLETTRQIQATQRYRARQDLVNDLRGLPNEVFQEIEDLLQQGGAPRRSPNELAEALRSLTTDEYRQLAALMWADSRRELPQRGREG